MSEMKLGIFAKMNNALTQERDEVRGLLEKPFYDCSHCPEQNQGVFVGSCALKVNRESPQY